MVATEVPVPESDDEVTVQAQLKDVMDMLPLQKEDMMKMKMKHDEEIMSLKKQMKEQEAKKGEDEKEKG